MIRSRPAFTLIELVAAIAAAAVLAGLLLTAVQGVRETAARIHCANNLRQLGAALHSFYDANGAFPTNGGPREGQAVVPRTAGCDWGFGDPAADAREQPGSWAYALLPFVGQAPAFQQQDQGAPVKIFGCPSRGRQNPQVCPPGDDPLWGPAWVYDCQGRDSWLKTDYAANGLVLPDGVGGNLTRDRVTDGLSNTIFLGEKSIDPRAYNTGGWYWDEPVFTGGSGGTARSGDGLYRDAAGVDFADNWGSAHSAGALFLFGDGGVRLVGFSVSTAEIRAALTPAGGEPPPTDF